ncbi:DUF58 domain-containing protein [Galactobacter caseinivorans]|uniref:DUF58 domain-containing protein n=1 Tax=Galactobacter caseinivorans TaxID=2676123 RepID=A0A496PKF3_9MICC|nr:DUF58 domain-containing protein [Galactobacter caseinivorans]RKW70976.1 DUF58 domain-containing protein [Galactobacter caseinivorans]
MSPKSTTEHTSPTRGHTRTRARLRGSAASSDTSYRTEYTTSVPLGTRTPRWIRRTQRAILTTRRALTRSWLAVLRATSPACWGLIAAAVLGIVLGAAFGWVEFMSLGVVAALTVALAALFLIGRPRYDVVLKVHTNRTTIGSPVRAEVQLRDRSRVRLWATRVEVGVGRTTVELPPPGRATAVREFSVPAEQRGVVRVGPVRTVRGDPIGLFRRSAEWSQTHEVYVHPSTVGLPPTSTGFVRDLEGNPTNDLTASDISFHALREYRAGDDPRHVYWKAVARTGQLMVRQFEETRRSHLVVAFGRDDSSWSNEQEFEMGISAAASLGLRAIRDGRDITVVTTPPEPELGADPPREPTLVPTVTPQRMLDGMSEIEWASGGMGVGELAALASATVPGISIVFLIVGSKPGMRELRSWSQRFPLGVQTMAVVCNPGQTPAMQDVSGLAVVRIGYLEDLRHALMKGGAS